eukprot:TRINITY_DN1209_c0_g1_i3.p1 TRINITY_DN1209_c0_g1~~TRINITY_DN1209_c0_g1_i3.p1  ORF type:complete len:368 (-),score=82.44 TRINITY_DN1209_c0_g1_i3:127-1197(-)
MGEPQAALQKESTDETKYLTNVLTLLNGFRNSKVLFASAKLGLFGELMSAPKSAQQLATQLNLSEDGLERLLNACVALDLLKKLPNDEYELPSSGKKLLCPQSETNVLGYIHHSNETLYKLWEKLEFSVKSGKHCWREAFQLKEDQGIFEQLYRSKEDLRRFLQGMRSFALQTMNYDAIFSAFDLSKYKLWSDVGGATGILMVNACKKYPNIQTQVLDLPAVLEITEEYLSKEEEEVRKRVNLVPLDFFQQSFPSSDLFILSRILHDWTDEQVIGILKKVYDALPNGGGVLIAEVLLNENRTSPYWGTIQNLNMLVVTEGKERNWSQFASLLSAVGFTNLSYKITSVQLDVILAVK